MSEIIYTLDESGRLNPHAALDYARRMREYLFSYLQFDFKQADPAEEDKHRLGVALDNLEECAAMLMSLAESAIAAAPGSSDEERCESGDPECGPVEFHDSEGVPLCRGCWEQLAVDAAPGSAEGDRGR